MGGGTIEFRPRHRARRPGEKSVLQTTSSVSRTEKFRSLKRHLRTQYNMTPSSIARSGVCRSITPWSLRTMQSPFRSRQGDGPRSAAPEAPFVARLSWGEDRQGAAFGAALHSPARRESVAVKRCRSRHGRCWDAVAARRGGKGITRPESQRKESGGPRPLRTDPACRASGDGSLRVAPDAFHHGSGAVRALRGEMLADADLAEDREGVDIGDLLGGSAGRSPLWAPMPRCDDGIAVAVEMQHWSPAV